MGKEKLSEHAVISRGEKIKYYVRTPEHLAPIGERLLLISVGMEWIRSLYTEPYRITADTFLLHGHCVLSFDTPCHGERTKPYGEHIEGLCAALLKGDDPFERFIEDAGTVIDDCIRRGVVKDDQIVVCGASRGGYLALRLLAADARVGRAAAFAPVTDWQYLREFAAVKDTETVGAQNLLRYMDELAGKPIFMAIGNHDLRVSTFSCCKLHVELAAHNASRGHEESLIEFFVTDDAGHTMGDLWYHKGTQFLLYGPDEEPKQEEE
ncbi:alpha/beta hydrolase family protein [Paenibacillus cymbidii]|uniref:alpha/beta hydrolase family protein n=1 Tax=Paenibacillus cymbidii TaxID=1639034 RepID=UPI00108177BC|nr:alpha/beta fold hydrolase [Paenibacillus cymbidii]